MAVRSSAQKLATRSDAFKIIRNKSFRRGKFLLVSGKESDFYLDMKPTLFDPHGANLVAELLLDRIKDRKVDCVGGLAMGAVPLVTAVTMLSAGGPKPVPGFVVRKRIKDHGTKNLIETAENLAGKNVAILDDVTTSGGSAMEAVIAAQEAGATVVVVLAVVDRGEGAAEFYREKGIPFEYLFHVREFMDATD